MRFTTILAFWAPMAICAVETWNLTGTCSGDHLCDQILSRTNSVCNGRAGRYAGTGKGGREWCDKKGTACTYVWQC
ncbi:hypothetical protein IWW34DRAFT_763533 [Fusarium oxysporum f. sp. albedinis]|nr:hypothetical protein IWW34DRAFT_763533 [Fusarium oxysporum f. sp. albedinis]